MVDSTSSVSKGVFVFKNGFNSKTTKRKSMTQENDNIYASQLWYQSYKELWTIIEEKIKKLNNEMFSNILSTLLDYIKSCYKTSVTEIPGATILMGINMPDHSLQFSALCEEIQKDISPHVASLNAEDCTTTKSLVENMVSQFVNDTSETNSDDEDLDIDGTFTKIKKSLCTFSLLLSWYNTKYSSSPRSRKSASENRRQKILVVIIPEFESFQESVLQDFVSIASSYINVLPFVIIFGVATSLASVHRTFPYHVSSKLNLEVFRSQSSTEYLNNIINNILFDKVCPFHLGGKTFNLFTDIFLFYDLSVKGFIHNFKFAMLEHYSYGNAMALCINPKKINQILSNFNHDDLENVRRLMSFRSFVESKSYDIRINLIENDSYFKSELKKCVEEFHDYIFNFHILLKCVHILASDLPSSPLGTQLRELYAIAVTQNLISTDEYKKCFQFMNMLSKDELFKKIGKMLIIVEQTSNSKNSIVLEDFTNLLNSFSINIQNDNSKFDEPQKEMKVLTENMNRVKLKEELLKMSKENMKPQNIYEKQRELFLKTLTEFFERYLTAPTSKPFHEIFFFTNATTIKNRLLGSHRAAIHTALNNPHFYMQCDCCKLPNDSSILPTLPDLSIVYKLHLECGKFINMYDWLQAFVMTVEPSENDEQEKNVDPKLQARFTKAVAELEFLGFIKSSRRKTDHVERLTWGGC